MNRNTHEFNESPCLHDFQNIVRKPRDFQQANLILRWFAALKLMTRFPGLGASCHNMCYKIIIRDEIKQP